VLKKDPPQEDMATQLFVVRATGEGNGQRVQVILDGSSPYISTGFISAMAVQALLEGKAKRFGYVSLAQTFGAKYVLNRMEEIGTKMRIETAGGKSASGNGRAAANA
jgi:hypothetical protein